MIGLVKNLKPVKGLITCKKFKLQTTAKTINIPKNTHLIIVEILYEMSKLYFTCFCSFKLDLNLNLDANSCNAPKGHAYPQNIRPNKKTVKSSTIKMTIIGRIKLILGPVIIVDKRV